MSITSLANYKKQPSHRRDNSGELDVFEAARYFSGYNDNFALVGDPNVREERDGCLRGGRRISLDMPSLKHHHYFHQHNYPIAHHPHHQPPQQAPPPPPQQIKEKKYKQPRSPGGKLAHFLNSLFSQTSSKKKKSSKSSTQSLKDEDDSPSGRRKRRSSISHFRSTSSLVDGKSLYSSSSSGFRTPPPYNLNTPTKSYKEFTNFSDHKDVLATLSKYSINGNDNGNGNGNGNAKKDEKIKGSSLDWIEEKNKLKNGFIEKSKNNYNHGYQENKIKKKEIKKFNDQAMDDGAESDSSSDLFELQIDYEFGFCSSGLPVYETTHMDSIKTSTAITNGPIKN